MSNYRVTRLADVTFKFKDGKEVQSHFALVERDGAVPKIYKCDKDLFNTEGRSILFDNYGKLYGCKD